MLSVVKNIHQQKDEYEVQFEQLALKHEAAIFQQALKIVKSTHIANDIVQDVLMKVWEERFNWHSIQKIDAWIYVITRNKLMDFLRKAASDRAMRQKIWEEIQQNQQGQKFPLEIKDSLHRLNKIVRELPPQRQLVFRLNKEGGLNHQEIADELSISKHTVKNQLFQAIKFLQKKFSGE